jgi:hypothetical protein
MSACAINRCRRPRLAGETRCGVHMAKKVVGDYVKARDGGCRICGVPEPLDWAHLIPQARSPMLRYDPDNAVALCREHHRYLDEHPRERDRLAELWLGEVAWSALKLRALSLERPDLAEIIERFREPVLNEPARAVQLACAVNMEEK